METLYVYFVSKSSIMKNALMDRVACLFMKYGIKSVSMDDVAREMGISKKTLYKMVTDKQDLVYKVIVNEFELNDKELNERTNSGVNAMDELLELSRFIMIHLKKYSPSLEYDLKKYYPGIFRELHDKKHQCIERWMMENLKKGKEQGLYRRDMNEKIVAGFRTWQLENMRDNPLFQQEEFSPPDIFREMFIYHIRGIASSKGLDFLEKNLNKINQTDLR